MTQSAANTARHIQYAMRLARGYSRRSHHSMDPESAALLGLAKGYAAYDATRGPLMPHLRAYIVSELKDDRRAGTPNSPRPEGASTTYKRMSLEERHLYPFPEDVLPPAQLSVLREDEMPIREDISILTLLDAIAIDAALYLLPKKHREVFRLWYYFEFTAIEIATVMCLSERSVYYFLKESALVVYTEGLGGEL